MKHKPKKVAVKEERKAYQQESFANRHQRMTIYLTQENFHELQYRREQGRIKNLTAFFNELLDREFF